MLKRWQLLSGLAPIDALVQFLKTYGRKATFHDPKYLLPAELPISEDYHVSIEIFCRIFIVDILPREIDHAIYLDSDMIALKSIASLFEKPIYGLLGA